MEAPSELPIEFEPIDDHLANIYEGLSSDILADEEERLRQLFLDIGSKILAINKIRGAE